MRIRWCSKGSGCQVRPSHSRCTWPSPRRLVRQPGTSSPVSAVVTGTGLGVERRSRRLGSTSRTTTAVADADLEVVAGQLTALTGPSGAGKTTLMAAVGGLLAPTTGRVDLALPLTPDGARACTRPPHEWSSVDLARVVAWVPQRAAHGRRRSHRAR